MMTLQIVCMLLFLFQQSSLCYSAPIRRLAQAPFRIELALER